MECEGVLQLASIREILELAGLRQAMVDGDVETKFIHGIIPHQDHRGEWRKDKDEFGKKILNLEEVLKKKMCPVVTVRSPHSEGTYMSHSLHAAVAVSIQNIYGEMQEMLTIQLVLTRGLTLALTYQSLLLKIRMVINQFYIFQ